jgi:hypothetical protein
MLYGVFELLLFSVDRVHRKGKFMNCLYFGLHGKFIDQKAGCLFVCAGMIFRNRKGDEK